MRLRHRSTSENETAALLEPDILEAVESLGEAITETLPPGVMDTLGPAQAPRRGSWHDPCALCAKPFRPHDRILPVLLSDGSRPYVHVTCLRKGEPKVEVEGCPHGITPPSACTYCSGKAMHLYVRSSIIRARAKGDCLVCSSAIVPGNLIAKVSCRAGLGWAHAWHLR